MAQRTNERDKLSIKISALSESEISDLLDYISVMETRRLHDRKTEVSDDDIISLLADATENKKAQMVHEWDRIRRRSDSRSSLGSQTNH